MRKFFDTYFKGDKIIWIIFALMIVLSTLVMYSASSSLAHRSTSSFYAPVWQHFGFLMTGFAVAWVIHRIPFKWVDRCTLLMYLFGLLLLALTFIIGQSTNGATRWISFGGLRFQPSEVAKVTTILMLANALSKNTGEKGTNNPDSGIWRYVAIVSIPVVLIVRENLSMCILFLMICFVMLILGRVSVKLLLKISGFAVVLAGLALVGIMILGASSDGSDPALTKTESVVTSKLHRITTWRNRIVHFCDDSRPHDEHYKIEDKTRQEDYAKIAVANGKWFGLGVGNSIQRDVLPLAYADFVYSIIVEEWGVLAFLVLILYLAFLYRVGVMVREQCRSVFQSLTALGLAFSLLIQVLVNVYIAVGLFPVSGQPLPLFSRGGTSIIITSVYFGIILMISRESMENNGKEKRATSTAVRKKEKEEITKE